MSNRHVTARLPDTAAQAGGPPAHTPYSSSLLLDGGDRRHRRHCRPGLHLLRLLPGPLHAQCVCYAHATCACACDMRMCMLHAMPVTATSWGARRIETRGAVGRLGGRGRWPARRSLPRPPLRPSASEARATSPSDLPPQRLLPQVRLDAINSWESLRPLILDAGRALPWRLREDVLFWRGGVQGRQRRSLMR